jgi:hypothetical protein
MDAETLRNEFLQWQGGTPGNISYVGGNVGIGTNNPVSPLQIHCADNYVQGISFSSTASAAVGPSDFMIQRGPSNNVTGGVSWNSSNCMIFHTPNESVATAGPVGFLWMSSGSRLGMFYDARNSRLGIGTTSPAYTLDVSGIGRFTTVTTGGWLLLALSTASYANGAQDLVWSSVANSRIALNANGIQFNIPDAGVYIINLQLNADTTATCNMTVGLYVFSGSWINQQNSEWNTTWNTSVETRCQFFINNTASTDYKFQILNGSGAAFAFSNSVVWSRASIFKIG